MTLQEKGKVSYLAKKKKKVTDNFGFERMDNLLEYNYLNIIDEIEQYQADLKRADSKAKKKALKKFNGKGFFPYEYQLEAREKLIKIMENNNFLDRIGKIIKQLAPVVKIISRLVASLIISILSIVQIQAKIKPAMLNKLKTVYNVAMAVG